MALWSGTNLEDEMDNDELETNTDELYLVCTGCGEAFHLDAIEEAYQHREAVMVGDQDDASGEAKKLYLDHVSKVDDTVYYTFDLVPESEAM